MHLLIRSEDVALAPALPAHSSGLTATQLIGGHTGSTHTGLMLAELTDGWVDAHVHSRETTFYVLSGTPALYLDGVGTRLKPGACGAIPVGLEHAWRADETARWIEMARRGRAGRRAAGHVLRRAGPDTEPAPLDVRDPRNRYFFLLGPRRHGSRPAQARSLGRRADGVGQHGDRGARLQRHHGEDARRQAARRAAPDDVHGPLPAGRRRAPSRPSVRGVVFHARRRGRGRRRRRALHAATRATSSGPASAASTPSTRRGQDRALARDVGPRPARPPLVPLRARLGVSREHRLDATQLGVAGGD